MPPHSEWHTCAEVKILGTKKLRKTFWKILIVKRKGEKHLGVSLEDSFQSKALFLQIISKKGEMKKMSCEGSNCQPAGRKKEEKKEDLPIHPSTTSGPQDQEIREL